MLVGHECERKDEYRLARFSLTEVPSPKNVEPVARTPSRIARARRDSADEAVGTCTYPRCRRRRTLASRKYSHHRIRPREVEAGNGTDQFYPSLSSRGRMLQSGRVGEFGRCWRVKTEFSKETVPLIRGAQLPVCERHVVLAVCGEPSGRHFRNQATGFERDRRCEGG